jgi:hypothetical protein
MNDEIKISGTVANLRTIAAVIMVLEEMVQARTAYEAAIKEAKAYSEKADAAYELLEEGAGADFDALADAAYKVASVKYAVLTDALAKARAAHKKALQNF